MCKQFFPFFSQLGNPSFEVLDKLPDGLHQAVGSSDFPVQVSDIRLDTTLFRVVLHLLVVFTEQLFAALVSSGGNRRLPLAALNNRDFVVWTGLFVSLLSLIGGRGGVLPPHFGQKKSRRPFSDFLLGVPLCGRRVFNCKSSGQVDPM